MKPLPPLPPQPLDANQAAETSAYRWPDLSVNGQGLSPEVEEGGWPAVRDLIYGTFRS
jgi:hypothetical protein